MLGVKCNRGPVKGEFAKRLRDSMYNKFVFLDIDGVLNSEYFYSLTASGDRSLVCESNLLDSYTKENIDRKAVERVLRICSETGAEIVLTSSWRLDNQCFYRLLPTGMVIHRQTPSLLWKYGTTCCRGQEIDEYLKKFPSERYCILDDDTDMLEYQLPHFIQIDSCFGLTDADAERAIDMLGKISA